MSFQGTKRRGQKYAGTVDLPNGRAERLLTLMGFKVNGYTHGEMPLKEALEGIQRAKAGVLEEDRSYLEELELLCQDLKRARRKELTWF